MNWSAKKRDWEKLSQDIQAEINAHSSHIPEGRTEDIQHYLDHAEDSMAFEFLFLEIMERGRNLMALDPDKAEEIALFFDLNDPEWCHYDTAFWPKFSKFLDEQREIKTAQQS